jgi:hypothetical protein
VIVIVSVLLAADAYFWQGKYMRMAMDTATGSATISTIR